MSQPWFDPQGDALALPYAEPAGPEPEERAERAASADVATTAARAARASAAASLLSAPPAIEPSPSLEAFPEPAEPAELAVVAEPVHAEPAVVAEPVAATSYSAWVLAGGIVGRMLLAFVAGCLVVTLLPIVIGWRPYVVQSGSMEPRIKVGDVVLASPEHDPKTLLGHVTVFTDPALPSHVKSHRVTAVNPDGTMTTKGDANPTADPVHVQPAQVRGIGRLLVRWAGLPLVWAWSGQFLLLGLFLVVLAAACWAVARDSEDDELDDTDDTDGDSDTDSDDTDSDDTDDTDDGLADGLGGEAAASPAAPGARHPEPALATRTSLALERAASRRRRRRPVVGRRAVVGAVGAAALLIPGTSAAFSATTPSSTAKWTVPAYNYATEVNADGPYLYWRLGDTGSTAADASGNGRTGTYTGTYTRGVTGGTPHSTPNSAVTSTTTTSCVNTTSSTAINGPTTFTEIVWFKTASGYTGGGKLIGFETPRTGVAAGGSGGTYDRHIYLDGAGKVWFGVYNADYETIGTSAAYNDGAWHMAAATLGSSGMALYIDGVLRASSNNTGAEATTGWWRVGCGNLSGWGGSWTGANNPGTTAVATNAPFRASLDDAAVFSGTALPASEISFLYWSR